MHRVVDLIGIPVRITLTGARVNVKGANGSKSIGIALHYGSSDMPFFCNVASDRKESRQLCKHQQNNMEPHVIRRNHHHPFSHIIDNKDETTCLPPAYMASFFMRKRVSCLHHAIFIFTKPSIKIQVRF